MTKLLIYLKFMATLNITKPFESIQLIIKALEQFVEKIFSTGIQCYESEVKT